MDKEEFKSPLLDAAITMHEMFSVYVQAGFTEDQALKLVMHMLNNNSGN